MNLCSGVDFRTTGSESRDLRADSTKGAGEEALDEFLDGLHIFSGRGDDSEMLETSIWLSSSILPFEIFTGLPLSPFCIQFCEGKMG